VIHENNNIKLVYCLHDAGNIDDMEETCQVFDNINNIKQSQQIAGLLHYQSTGYLVLNDSDTDGNHVITIKTINCNPNTADLNACSVQSKTFSLPQTDIPQISTCTANGKTCAKPIIASISGEISLLIPNNMLTDEGRNPDFYTLLYWSLNSSTLHVLESGDGGYPPYYKIKNPVTSLASYSYLNGVY
jgi:hypothetical protein